MEALINHGVREEVCPGVPLLSLAEVTDNDVQLCTESERLLDDNEDITRRPSLKLLLFC